MWAALNTSNVVQTRYLWTGGESHLLAQINVGTAAVSFALTDSLGSVSDLTDGSSVLDHIQYGSFGAITTQTSPENGSGIGFTGSWEDAAAGIVDAEDRTLSVNTHQWLQEDPIGISGGQANFFGNMLVMTLSTTTTQAECARPMFVAGNNTTNPWRHLCLKPRFATQWS